MTPPPEERFWSKVDKSGECWVFQAAVGESGYPKFTIRTGLPVWLPRTPRATAR